MQTLRTSGMAHRLHVPREMPTMLVTCPETAHLQEIDYVDDPHGLLIIGCSAWTPECPASCARTCAARLDRKKQASRLAVGTVLAVRSRLRGA